MSRKIRVGTRGSELALTQTRLVITLLKEAHPGAEFEIVTVRTAGDGDARSAVGSLGVGVFVKELENALEEGRVDVAVHSLKDMPSVLPPGFLIAAVPPREDPRDALISSSGATLEELPRGARVATGSPRRKSLLLSERPDLSVEPVRGNVPTRLEKLKRDDGPDALVLAAAGLNRLGLQAEITQYLKCMEFVAAVGQGALALEVRADDRETAEVVSVIEDAEARATVDAERAFLAKIEGGCSAPTSAHAQIRGGEFRISAFAATPDGSRILRARHEGDIRRPEELGEKAAEDLLEQGADGLLSKPAAHADGIQ